MQCQPCPVHRDGAPLPAGLCAGGGCAETSPRMTLRWLLGHRFAMLSARWMLEQLKVEIPEATQHPAQVPAGPSCWVAAPPHRCAGGHAGRAAGAPRHVPAIGNPGPRVTGQPGANHRVTPRAVAAALPITSHQCFNASRWVQPAGGCHHCPHAPRTCHRHGDISATSTLCCTAQRDALIQPPAGAQLCCVSVLAVS